VASPFYAAESLEAFRQGRKAPPDLALIDYPLREISGAELTQKLKDLFPNLPIVMISGCAALPDEELAFADAYFGQARALDDLLATICGLALANELRATNVRIAAQWTDTT
jgi:CheY-like chemotaxis protein